MEANGAVPPTVTRRRVMSILVKFTLLFKVVRPLEVTQSLNDDQLVAIILKKIIGSGSTAAATEGN